MQGNKNITPLQPTGQLPVPQIIGRAGWVDRLASGLLVVLLAAEVDGCAARQSMQLSGL